MYSKTLVCALLTAILVCMNSHGLIAFQKSSNPDIEKLTLLIGENGTSGVVADTNKELNTEKAKVAKHFSELLWGERLTETHKKIDAFNKQIRTTEFFKLKIANDILLAIHRKLDELKKELIEIDGKKLDETTWAKTSLKLKKPLEATLELVASGVILPSVKPEDISVARFQAELTKSRASYSFFMHYDETIHKPISEKVALLQRQIACKLITKFGKTANRNDLQLISNALLTLVLQKNPVATEQFTDLKLPTDNLSDAIQKSHILGTRTTRKGGMFNVANIIASICEKKIGDNLKEDLVAYFAGVLVNNEFQQLKTDSTPAPNSSPTDAQKKAKEELKEAFTVLENALRRIIKKGHKSDVDKALKTALLNLRNIYYS